MPRIGKRGFKPMSARGYASAGIQHRIYIKKEDVPRWNVIREKSGYTKSPDFIHWLIEIAEQHLRINSSDYQAEGNAGEDSHTSDESEESDDDDDDDDDGDIEDDNDDDTEQQSKEVPRHTTTKSTSSSSSRPDSHAQVITIKGEELSRNEGGEAVRGRSRKLESPKVAIKDVAPIICFDLDAPRQLRPRLKLKLKPLKIEPPVVKQKRGRRKSQTRSPKKPTMKEKSAGYSCKKCCRIFADRQALRSHQAVHAVDNLTCRDCQMTFNSKSAMWVHRKVQHSNKTLACEHCDMTFPRKYQLKEHMRGHKGIKPFACPTCNKKFRTTAHLTSHMDLHSNFRRYLCDLCGLTFHRRDLLSRHIIKHSQPKTYSCEECGKVFAYKVTLQDHLIRHQNVKAGKTPYKCQTCFKEFFTPKSYQHHMGRHRGEKVFSCNQCDKKFKQKFYLDRHKIIHQEEKPYTCSNCGRGFTQHSNMAIHMRTHTGEKPYQCDLCEKAFAHNVSLKTHKKTAHGIDMWQNDKTKPVVALGRPKGEPKKKPPAKIRLKSRAAAAEMQIQSDLYQAAVEFARERLAPLAFPTVPQIPAIHSSPVEQIPAVHSPSESEDETPSPGSSTDAHNTPPNIKTVLDHHPTHNHHEHQQAHERRPSHDHQPVQDRRSSHDHRPSHDHHSSHDHHLANDGHHQLQDSHATSEQKPLHEQLLTCRREPPHEMHSHDNHQDFSHPQTTNPEIIKQILPLTQQYHERSQELNEHLSRGPQQFHKHDHPTREVREQLTPIPQAYTEPSHDVREQMTPIPQSYQEQTHEVREQLTPISQAFPEHSSLEQHQASRSQTPNSSITSSIDQPYTHILHNQAMHSPGEHPLRLDKPSSPFGPLLHSPNAHSDYSSRHEKVEQWHQRNSEALSWMSRGVSHAQLMQGLRAVTPTMMHPVSQALGMLNPQTQEHVNLVGSYAHSAYIQRSNSSGSQPMQPPSWRS
ncbi:zinc finger protein 652-like [Patiria miniata]|uniref:C2H2-type domain-containing protein n=1 Tax=Patiria miniata TaxID=46514 RepID=A0A914B7K9_PATMI|nr:zinc finger protein 652-like [Patiria miniata]